MAGTCDEAPLIVDLDLDGNQPSLTVTGKANQSNIGNLADVLDRLADEHSRCVALDLDGLESIDSAAIERLARSAVVFRDHRKRLRLRRASGEVHGVFDRLMISDVFCLKKQCGHKRHPDSCGFAREAWALDVFTLPCQMPNCHEARSRVDCVADAVGFGACRRNDVMLAVGEAVANAGEYGRSASEESYFTVSCLVTPHKLSVSVGDHGPGFCVDDLPDSPRETFLERGRGIYCMNAVMDEVGFSFDHGTTVRMVKLGG